MGMGIELRVGGVRREVLRGEVCLWGGVKEEKLRGREIREGGD